MIHVHYGTEKRRNCFNAIAEFSIFPELLSTHFSLEARPLDFRRRQPHPADPFTYVWLTDMRKRTITAFTAIHFYGDMFTGLAVTAFKRNNSMRTDQYGFLVFA